MLEKGQRRTGVTCSLLLWLTACPLLAQRTGTEAGAILALKRAFGRKSEQLREELRAQRREQALTRIRSFDSAAVYKALLRVYRQLEDRCSLLDARRIPLLKSGGGRSAVFPRLQARPDRAWQRSIREKLLALSDPNALEATLATLLRRKSESPFHLRVLLASKISALGSDSLSKLLTATKNAKKDESRILLLRCASAMERRGQALGPWIVEQLHKRGEELRVEAANALAALRWPPSLAPLIEAVNAKQRRVAEAAATSLEKLTGQSLGTSKLAWKAWLEKEGAPYLSGEKELGLRKPPRQSKAKKRASNAYYFGIPQDGKSILYVIDASQSMQAKLGGKKGKETRFQRSKRELLQALEALDERKFFNVLAFANPLWSFEKTQVVASSKNKALARAWVEALRMKFGTNSYDALELAFVRAGRGAEDRYYVPSIDTVFFLSDGAPTRQKKSGARLAQDDPIEILDAVRRWNPLGRVTIHSIGLGLRGKRALGFMRQLSAQNHGRFVRIRN